MKKQISLEEIDLCQGGSVICQVGPWTLHSGDRWWVQGPNGCGKSTFLRVLAGELWPAPGQHERRLYHFNGETTWSPMVAKGHMALLTPERQNRYLHQDWNLNAAEVVATGFLDTDILHERPRPEEIGRLADLMTQLAIRELWERPFLELSQGERRRVLIARALASNPDILLLDEFTEGLDAPSRETVWETLEELASEGKSIVLTSHRNDHTPRDWSVLDLKPSASPKTSKPDSAFKEQSAASNETLVRARGGLYLEGQLLVDGLDWKLEAGDHTAVVGANGSGKTSLLRLLWGELHLALGGEVIHFEDPSLTVQAVRKRVSYFQPDMHAWFRPEQEAQDVILSGLFSTIDLFDPVSHSHRTKMRDAARVFGITSLLNRSFGTLSYGQARLVLLARALVARPALALLDEPLDGLDRSVRSEVLGHLESLAAEGHTTFVLSHHHEEDQPSWLRQRLQICQRTRTITLVKPTP